MSADSRAGALERLQSAYRERVEAGGCNNRSCDEPGRPGFAVWWRCPDGHREELRYCEVHGPVHLGIAMRGALIECRACGGWMTPLIEGCPPRAVNG
jgi:hypothetical protein